MNCIPSSEILDIAITKMSIFWSFLAYKIMISAIILWRIHLLQLIYFKILTSTFAFRVLTLTYWIIFFSDIGRESYTPTVYDNVVTKIRANVQVGFGNSNLAVFVGKILCSMYTHTRSESKFRIPSKLMRSFSNEKVEPVTTVSCGLIVFILLLPMWVR